MEQKIKQNVDNLIEELFELDDKISLKEDCLKSCNDNTRHLHLTDLKKLEKRYSRKFQLVKLTRG